MKKLGEESETIRWRGKPIKAKAFRYPVWLLASIISALYILIFQVMVLALVAKVRRTSQLP